MRQVFKAVTWFILFLICLTGCSNTAPDSPTDQLTRAGDTPTSSLRATTPTNTPADSFTANQELITYTSSKYGSYDIFIMNADGSDLRRLTDDSGTEGYAALSPDGSKIAFYAYDDLSIWSIYVMDIDGTNRQRLTNRPGRLDAAPTWSPDGTQILFGSTFNEESDIWVMNADGSNLKKIEGVSGESPSWSPDGSQIVYVSTGEGDGEIYIMDVDGSNQRQVTDNGVEDWWPAWSPDGTQITFMSGNSGHFEIYVMNADGSDPRQLTDNGSENYRPSWSPDGSFIIFCSGQDGDFEIYTMNADGSNQQQLTHNRVRDIQPAWWPALEQVTNTKTELPPVSLEKSVQSFDPKRTFKVGLGDLDGDGDLDAVFANMGFNNSQVLLNDGNGYFADTRQELTQQGHGVALGDLDNDGDLDVFISCAGYTENNVKYNLPNKIYLNRGDGTFQDSGQDLGDTGLSGTSVDLFDIDGDGDLDAHATYYIARDIIYLNNGRAQFSDSGKDIPEGSNWADLDNDDDVDIFIRDMGFGYKTMLNDGDGNFTDYWQMEDKDILRGGISLGDVDGDGDPDAVIGLGDNTGSEPTMILLNDGTGRFSDSGQKLNETSWASFGLADLNADGYVDIFVSNFLQPNQVWVNNGTGQFINTDLDLGGDTETIGVSIGDLDGDGDDDIFVSDFGGGKNEIWFNTSSP